jgi:protein-L-isoaspartate(D-aspartate) O-methyltransferase
MTERPLPTWPDWITRQLVRRGVQDERVLAAMARVPREEFIPRAYRGLAHEDGPVPIGCGQTISQPYVVALSLEAMELTGNEKVLDIGTGSGYQACLLSYLAREVYTIEVYQQLFIDARLVIGRFQRSPVYCRHGDGSLGWPDQAPFDAIVAGARAPKLPQPLIDQLAPGGRLVLPVGGEYSQVLYQIVKQADGTLKKKALESVRFVPLVGKAGTGGLPE